jgi:hypothetical protein
LNVFLQNYQNIYPPSATLHLSNIPASVEESDLKQAFQNINITIQVSTRYLDISCSNSSFLLRSLLMISNGKSMGHSELHYIYTSQCFRIRIVFNADPDPTFYINVVPDPDSDLGMRIRI